MLSQSATEPEGGNTKGAGERFVTQRDAAILVGCSKDTIVRARRAGRFPHASLDGHTWRLPIDDLAAAGLYDKEAQGRVAPHSSGAGAKTVSIDLARAQARIDALEDLVARQDGELHFLRQLTTDSLGHRAAS